MLKDKSSSLSSVYIGQFMSTNYRGKEHMVVCNICVFKHVEYNVHTWDIVIIIKPEVGSSPSVINFRDSSNSLH